MPGHRIEGFRQRFRGLFVSCSLALWLLTSPLVSASDEALRVPVDSSVRAVLAADGDLFAEARPLPGEGLLRFSERLCGSSEMAELVAEANPGTRRLLDGFWYRVPFQSLTAELQVAVVQALFEQDRAVADGWQHLVHVSSRRGVESLWDIAEWFTGRGENFRALREWNGLVEEDLVPGQRITVPADLLRPAFRSALPASSPYHLEYRQDELGPFAVYRLKSGEALYSSVVMRFTGAVFSDDVNAMAETVAARSGIRDVTDIPIGFEVKMPFDILLAEYLPPDHERRREWEQGRLASSRFSNQVRASRLQGVTVVLDAGHGGMDVGASVGGVWESVYVYDIMVRVKSLLESVTAANVIATTQDGTSYQVVNRDRLPQSKGHRVLVTPNYRIEDSRTGVHFRWYLANSIHRQATTGGGDPAKIIFLSIHADSLHPSVRGAMFYIPGANYRSGSYGKSGAVYSSRREVRERPRVSYSSRERIESEGLSRDLAGHVLDGFRQSRLAIHPDRPIREKIIRRSRPWVPAVMRYNAIPAQALVEVCNLANSEDRRLIQTQAFRQTVAEAIVRGVLGYYGQAEGASELLVAAAGG